MPDGSTTLVGLAKYTVSQKNTNADFYSYLRQLLTDFYARQHIYMYAIARIPVCHVNSVRPSVCHTRVLYQNG